MRSRILSLALALVMCLGLLPVPTASASDSEDLSQNYEVFEEWDVEMLPAPGGYTIDQRRYRYGLKDKAGNVVIPAIYAGMKLFKGMIIAAGEGADYRGWYVDYETLPKYGVIDINQNVILPFYYESIEPLSGAYSQNYVYPADASNGYLKIVKNGLSGVMTEDFQIVIPPSYYEINYAKSGCFYVSDTHNADANPRGHMSYGISNRWGLCDKTGKLVVPVQYENLSYLGGDYYAVMNNNYQGVINSKNETIIPMKYAFVDAVYENSFIVASYAPDSDTDDETRRLARLTISSGTPYWGPLLVTYGIVDLKNQPLIDMNTYAKITVNADNGRFTCCRWNGELKPAKFSVAGTGSSYEYVYEYDYINYSDLGVPVSRPDTPAPAPSTGGYPIPDSKGLAEFSAPPLGTFKDTMLDTDVDWEGLDELPEKEITVYEVANGTKLMLTDAAKEKKYTVLRMGEGSTDYSTDAITLYPAGPEYDWYLLTEAGESYAEAEVNSLTLYIRPINLSADFSDVKASDYYYDAIQWAVKYGVTTGTSATAFSPNDTCTVGQILTFLWRVNGATKSGEYGEKKFSNITRNDYYYYAALWALDNEIVSGTSFAANTPCTRAMVAEYLWKMSDCPTPNTASRFTDVPSSADYAQAVSWMVENGITTGTGTTTFSPDETCTRGQIAAFI